MTKVKGNIYSAEIPAGTNVVVFNNGNGSQSGDYNPQGNHLYTESTDTGEYDGEGGGEVVVAVPDKLYIQGTVNGTSWDTSKAVAMTKSGNKFTIDEVMLSKASSTDDWAYFQFSTAIGKDWDVVNGSDRYGAPAENTPITAGTPAEMTRYIKDVNASSCQSWKIEAGIYGISVDFDANTVTVTKKEAGTGTLSAADVTIKPNGEAVLEISLANSKPIAALQFDVQFPNNVTSNTPTLFRTDGTLKAQSSQLASGAYRYVVAPSSTENVSSFTGNEGKIMEIPLRADASALIGEYDLVFTNVIYSAPTGEKVKPGNFTAKMTVEASEEVSTIELDKKIISLKVGGSYTLTATIMPANTPAEGATWASSDATIATVDNTGKVTAVKNGKATITVTHGTMKATCDVYVGKEAQTITWGEVPAKLLIGGEFTLNATSSSNLAVTYTITSGATFAHITDGKLIADNIGTVTIEANQEGNDTYAPANPETVSITIWLGHDMGDVNMDNTLTIGDVTATINHILETTLITDPTALLLADMDKDGSIDVADVVLIVNAILAQPATTSNPAAAPARFASQNDMERFEMTCTGDLLNVKFTNMQDYVATEFELVLPEGVEVVDGQVMGSKHTVAIRNLGDNIARVVVYSMTNAPFNKYGSIVLQLTSSNIERAKITSALIGTTSITTPAEGATYDTCGVEIVEANASDIISVYNINGIRVYSGDMSGFEATALKGVYIVKTADKTYKVVR